MTFEGFDRTRLSAREDAILEAAIEGKTDVQIAQGMAISQSTVNSYWVRIRGKLGQLSRTELVALALKAKARADLEAVTGQLAALQQTFDQSARNDPETLADEMRRAALDAMPEALMVTDEEGEIKYTNRRAESIFGYGAGELAGLTVGSLLGGVARSEEARLLSANFEGGEPFQIGLDQVVYGRRKDGTHFRIVLLVDSRPTAAGRVHSVIVRDFVTEVDTRRTHVSAWN